MLSYINMTKKYLGRFFWAFQDGISHSNATYSDRICQKKNKVSAETLPEKNALILVRNQFQTSPVNPVKERE